MKGFRLWALALALTCFIAGPARAAAWDDTAKGYLGQLAAKSVNGNVPRGMNADPHFITMNPPQWYDAEQAAISGFSWGNAPDRMVVGGAFRGYSDGSPWAFGIATEAIASPTSNAHLIGAELDVISRNPNSTGQKWGLNIIFFNRIGSALESGMGANLYNENTRAIVIESLPRSFANELSGWQTGIYFGTSAFDKTASRPYAVAIDMSDVQPPPTVQLYVLTWQCGFKLKCGLKATDKGLEYWKDIDADPRLVRVL